MHPTRGRSRRSAVELEAGANVLQKSSQQTGRHASIMRVESSVAERKRPACYAETI